MLSSCSLVLLGDAQFLQLKYLDCCSVGVNPGADAGAAEAPKLVLVLVVASCVGAHADNMVLLLLSHC